MFEITTEDLIKAAAVTVSEHFNSGGPDVSGPVLTGGSVSGDPVDERDRRSSAKLPGSVLNDMFNGGPAGPDVSYGFKLPEFESWLSKDTPYKMDFEHALHGLDDKAPATTPELKAASAVLDASSRGFLSSDTVAELVKEANFYTEEDVKEPPVPPEKSSRHWSADDDGINLEHIGDDVDDADDNNNSDADHAETQAHIENIMGQGVTDEEKDEELFRLLETKAAGDILKFADLLFKPEGVRDDLRKWAVDAKRGIDSKFSADSGICEPAIMGYVRGLEEGGMNKAAALDTLIIRPHPFEKDAVMRYICWSLPTIHGIGQTSTFRKALEKRAEGLGLDSLIGVMKENPWLAVALASSLLGAGGYGLGGWTGAAGSLLPVAGYTMMNSLRKQPDPVSEEMSALTS